MKTLKPVEIPAVISPGGNTQLLRLRPSPSLHHRPVNASTAASAMPAVHSTMRPPRRLRGKQPAPGSAPSTRRRLTSKQAPPDRSTLFRAAVLAQAHALECADDTLQPLGPARLDVLHRRLPHEALWAVNQATNLSSVGPCHFPQTPLSPKHNVEVRRSGQNLGRRWVPYCSTLSQGGRGAPTRRN